MEAPLAVSVVEEPIQMLLLLAVAVITGDDFTIIVLLIESMHTLLLDTTSFTS